MNNSLRRNGTLAGVLLLGLIMGGCGGFGTRRPSNPDGDAKRGGALYDKYWKIPGVTADEPTEDHPLWATQTTNTRSGADTWRCKECHGWDYKGIDGAYSGTSSHRTGFTGIFETTLDEDDVFDLIEDDHGYGDAGLSDQDIADLAAFVVDGLIDTDPVIDANGAFTGSAADGVAPYTTACSACHGADGTMTGVGGVDPDHDEFPGVLSNDNAWEFLHKVRFGHPGTNMPPQFGILELDTMSDLGAYAQTLPTEAPASFSGNVARGGAMYDKYWNVPGVTAAEPTGDHPLWANQTSNTRTGADTWRCKECHGWDYKGINGAYSGTSSHRTGFAGIDATTLDEAGLVDLIGTDHGYGAAGLSDDNIADLAAFVLDGLIDTDDIIDADGAFTGSAADGVAHYAICSACHDADGLGIPFGADPDHDEFVGKIANENPWEFQHKVRFGQPGSSMPPQFGVLDIGAIGDLGAHAQTLPES